MDSGEQVCGGRRGDTSCSGELSLASRIVIYIPPVRGKIRPLPKLQSICNKWRNFHIAWMKGRSMSGKMLIEIAWHDPKTRYQNTLKCKNY